MKHLISLLAFNFLIGCDGEKSNLAPSKNSTEETATEASSKDSLGEQQKVNEEAKNTSLPPIPDPMDAEAIMKLWSMEHDPTGFIEEMKQGERPGTWERIIRSGPAKNQLFQSEENSYELKWVNKRFASYRFVSATDEVGYGVSTYLPEENSFIYWFLNNNEITQLRADNLEKGDVKWQSSIMPKSAFGYSLENRRKPTNDGFELSEYQKLSKDGEPVLFNEGKAYWTGFPGMKPLGKKEVLELAKLPHDPDLKDPKIKGRSPKAGIWEGKDTVRTRDSEQEEEFKYRKLVKRVDESHTVFTNIKDGEILSLVVEALNPNKETEHIQIIYFPGIDELFRGISFWDQEARISTFNSLRQRDGENRISVEGHEEIRSEKGSSNFATNFNGSSKFRDDGKLMSIVKIKGEWVKELPAEGEELSNEWLEKKLAEIDSLEEAE
ncbi:hypothetical protein OAF10_01435 [bacterium]|nr:hypothetical protein [bacterium]